MNPIKRAAAILLALTTMSVPIPADDLQTIEKVYVISSEFTTDSIELIVPETTAPLVLEFTVTEKKDYTSV